MIGVEAQNFNTAFLGEVVHLFDCHTHTACKEYYNVSLVYTVQQYVIIRLFGRRNI